MQNCDEDLHALQSRNDFLLWTLVEVNLNEALKGEVWEFDA